MIIIIIIIIINNNNNNKIFKVQYPNKLKVLESYFSFIFNRKIYSSCQNNSISNLFFQNLILNII